MLFYFSLFLEHSILADMTAQRTIGAALDQRCGTVIGISPALTQYMHVAACLQGFASLKLCQIQIKGYINVFR